MGKLQPKGRDPVELAADPAAAGARPVRRCARGRASGRAQPLTAILGARRDAASRTRGGTPGPLGVVDAARIRVPEYFYAALPGTGTGGNAIAGPPCAQTSSPS